MLVFGPAHIDKIVPRTTTGNEQAEPKCRVQPKGTVSSNHMGELRTTRDFRQVWLITQGLV
jgi:hypothetical protein